MKSNAVPRPPATIIAFAAIITIGLVVNIITSGISSLLGVVIWLGVIAFLVRGSRVAWIAAIVLTLLSLVAVLVLVVLSPVEVPVWTVVLGIVLTLGALAMLVADPTRAFVARRGTSAPGSPAPADRI